MSECAGSSTNNYTRNYVTINDADANTLANAIVIAMRMNDGNRIQQRESGAKDIASAVIMALSTTTRRTNTLTTTTAHMPLRASSTMGLTNDSIISPPYH
ncbi:unnamed protein product [Rotaria sp. Silwood2]|nr:unnamed protein product [Rotaria sp. Silwood2]CAF2975170.1 unnamed protein product [Rotaria sp. Silwood2]CAF3295290.1 unnamed protein product [Rotaria sp. Silwood2]CAF3352424.1 unnamed protein product [Rotaria sp. Silwood2]CAF4365468.1 unnamed protein product [Rotaria sp. Silwood2]